MVRETAIDVGMTLRTADGHRVEITNDRPDGRVCLHFPDRTGADGGAYTEWRTRSAVAGAIDDDVFDVADDRTVNDPVDPMPGRFTDTTPRCPRCGSFMSTGFDGEGFPAATCPRTTCDGRLGASALIDRGCFVQ